MANIAPAGNANAAVQLNSYITEVPEKNAKQLRSKALALNVLAIITIVAIVAIVGAVLAVSLGIGAMTGTMPFILVGLALTTPFLSMGTSKLRAMASTYSEKGAIEQGVADELKKITHWRTPEIEAFLREKGIDPNQLPIDALRLVSPQEPLRALLPLIARFNYNNSKAHASEVKAQEGFVDTNPDPVVHLNARRLAWVRLESDALPNALKAALLLQIISQPHLLYRNVEDLGQYDVKHFDQRFFGQQLDQEDTYLKFNDAQREPIRLGEIVQIQGRAVQVNMDPQALRQKLFIPAVRV